MGFCPPEAYGLLGKHDINIPRKTWIINHVQESRKDLHVESKENSPLPFSAGWTKTSEL